MYIYCFILLLCIHIIPYIYIYIHKYIYREREREREKERGMLKGFVTIFSSARWALGLGPLASALEKVVTKPFTIPLYIFYSFIEATYNKFISLL